MKLTRALLLTTLLTVLLAAGCTNSMEKLMTAAQKGDVQAVEAQLADGTPVDTTDPTGSTALLYAAGKGHAELVELLIAKGADVNVKDNEGFMPLHAAVGAGKPKIVEMLLKSGADAEATFRGITPLAVAERKGNEEIMAMLKDAMGIVEPPPLPEPEADAEADMDQSLDPEEEAPAAE
jgi:ankyrin repeat protein